MPNGLYVGQVHAESATTKVTPRGGRG